MGGEARPNLNDHQKRRLANVTGTIDGRSAAEFASVYDTGIFNNWFPLDYVSRGDCI